MIVTPDPTLLAKFRFLQNAHGAVPSPFDAWLLIRSIKTLALRSKQHGLNGLAVARYLQEVGVQQGLVRDVRYPGLKRVNETSGERAERELAWEQLSDEARRWATKQGFTRDGEGGFPSGGMVSFHIASEHRASQTNSDAAERFLEALKLFARKCILFLATRYKLLADLVCAFHVLLSLQWPSRLEGSSHWLNCRSR